LDCRDLQDLWDPQGPKEFRARMVFQVNKVCLGPRVNKATLVNGVCLEM